ncbi:zinc finger protein 879-like isoform X2 [Leguminivora glycinivorella]|nr:zinc finger protein 879-like isoform X2 [Leguminivora glycinivorella]
MDNLPFQTVCDDCVVSAIQSYTFIKQCKENTDNLQQAIENLDISLQKLTSQETCKAVFLSLDSSLAAHVYYDYKKPVTSIPKALARFKYVSSDVCNGKYYIERSEKKQFNTWIAPNVSDDDDFDKDWCISPEKRNKTKRGHRGKEYLSDRVILRQNSTNKKLICNGCEKPFENITMLRMHYMRVHAVKKIKCPKCDRKFATSKLLEYHLSLSHANAVCFECGKTFTNIASLKKHEDSHNISSKYVCQNCHRVYKTLRTMKEHIYNGVCERGGRTGKFSIGKFICDICDNRFATKNAVRSHLITLHGFGSDDAVHTCTWCNKRFEALSSLKGHIVKHTRERRFQCDLCNEKFVTHPALVNHTRLHTGERPYSCEYCDESFISASRRMEHTRRKHLEPSLPCRLCPMIFKSGAGKRKHERRHFNPTSKLYVPKALRPVGIKEPKEPTPSNTKRRVVIRMNVEN